MGILLYTNSTTADFLKTAETLEYHTLIERISESKRFLRRHSVLFKQACFVTTFASFQDGWHLGEEGPVYIVAPVTLEDQYWSLASQLVSHNLLVTYLKSMYRIYLDCEYEVEGERKPVLGEGESFGQHLGSLLCETLKRCKDKVFTMMSSSWVSICDKLKAIFKKTLGSFLSTVMSHCAWIESFWDMIATRATEIYEQTAGFLVGFGELVLIGMALISSVALVAFTEQFLVVCGILREPIGLTKMFIPAAIALFGVATFMEVVSHAAGAVVDSLIKMVAFFLEMLPLDLMCDGNVPKRRVPKQGTESKGQYMPSDVIGGFTASLQSFFGSGLQEMGKTAQAFNSLTAALKNVKNGAATGMAYVASALDAVLGTQNAELGDLSIILGLGLQDWLKEIDVLEEHFLLMQSSSKALLMRATVLNSRGKDLMAAIASKAVTPSTAVMGILVKASERIKKLKDALMLQGCGGSRVMPFVVALVGPSRTGKTLLTERVARLICEHDGLPELDCYSRQSNDEFWSGYRRQHVVVQDDFAAVEHGISDEASLMALISSQECRLNMADLAEKGLFFDSGAFIYSSNFVDASPVSKVHDRDAFRNRRNLVVRVSRDPTKQYDRSDFTANQKYELLEFVDDSPVVMQTYDKFDDLQCHILNAYEEHKAEKSANLRSFQKKDNVVCGMKNMFKSFACEHRDIQGATGIHIGKNMEPFLIWEGSIWCIQEGELVLTPYESKEAGNSPGIMSLGRALEALRMAPNVNTVSLLYLERVLKNLKEGPNWTISETQWSAEPYIQEFLQSLTLEQRVVLILCHREFCKDMNEQTWVGRLWRVLVDQKNRIAAAISKWPLYVKAIVGVTLMVALGGCFWKLLRTMGSLCTGAGFSTFGASFGASYATMSEGQSRAPTRNADSDYKFKNIPLRARHRTTSYGQNSSDWEANEIAMRHLAVVKVGDKECGALLLPGKKLVMVGHFARGVVVRTRVKLQRASGIDLFCTLDPKEKHYIEGSELVYFHVNTLPDVRASAMRDICWDVEDLTEEFQMQMFVFKRNLTTGNHEFVYDETLARVRTQELQVRCGDYLRVVPKCVQYPTPTENYDCGGLVIAKIAGSWKLVAIHVAGDGVSGQACFVPRSLKQEVKEVVFTSQGQCDLGEFFQFHPFDVTVGPSLSVAAHNKQMVFMPSKTKLEEVPKEWQVFGAESKEPSILSALDPRIPEAEQPFDLFSVGMSKYKHSAQDLDQDVLDNVVKEMTDSFAAAGAGNFSAVGMHTALNGEVGCDYFDSIVTATSEGFPWVYERQGNKGKTRYLEGEPGNWSLPKEGPLELACAELELAAREGRNMTLVGIECPKDELLPLRKIRIKPKTRLFTVLPQEYNIVLRKLTLPFVAWMMQNRSELASKVGINPYSREWNQLAMTLQEKGDNILCCDYSSFDGLCTPQLMGAMIGIMKAFYGRTDGKAIETLLMSVFQRYSICGSRVYQVSGGIPSGIALTVILNSLMNEILVRYCWRTLMKSYGPTYQAAFHLHCRMVVYGDDNLISVGAGVADVFNGGALKTEMARIGVTITDGVDKTLDVLKFRRLEECDFLKRGFVLNKEGLWKGPQDLLSLYSQLTYVRTSSYGSMAEAFAANCENVLREMWLHGERQTREFRNKVHALGFRKLPTIAQVEAFHEEQMGHAGSSIGVELFSNTAFLGNLVATSSEVCHMALTPEVSCAAVGMDKGDEYLVCLGVPVPRQRDGLSVNLKVGVGRGGLPTAEDLQSKFGAKNSNIRKQILTQLRTHQRKICFVSPNGNVVGAVIALAWLRACNIVDQNFVSVGYQKAIDVCSKLGYRDDIQDLLLSH